MTDLQGAPPGVVRLLRGRPVFEVRPGLERIRSVLRDVGDPHLAYTSLHVAGTNGKGSVVACAAAVLAAGGVRVGSYLSPHLLAFPERIQLDGSPAAPGLLERCARRLQAPADAAGTSFFEATTALAFLALAEAGADRAVVEVGMGGRWDATNVLRPLACAVTSVSRDHERFLGHGLAEIAREKAGILKPEVPAVVGPVGKSAREVLRESAAATGSPLWWWGRTADVDRVQTDREGTGFRYRSPGFPRGERFRVSLAGAHQAVNAGLALLLLEAAGEDVPASAARRGLAEVRHPGRLQVVERDGAWWIFDVAHNPAGLSALLRGLEDLCAPRPRAGVVSILADKPWSRMLDRLGSGLDAVVCTTAPSSPESRRWDLQAVRSKAAGIKGRRVRVEDDFDVALARAGELAGGGTVVVTGSAYTVGDALRRSTGRSGA